MTTLNARILSGVLRSVRMSAPNAGVIDDASAKPRSAVMRSGGIGLGSASLKGRC